MKSYDIRFVVREHTHTESRTSFLMVERGRREWTIYNGRDSAAIVSGREAIQTGFIVSAGPWQISLTRVTSDAIDLPRRVIELTE